MTLDGLFVSYKLVEPIKFNFLEPSLPQPIYLNLNRALKVTNISEDNKKENLNHTSKLELKENKILNWKVNNYKSESIPMEKPATNNSFKIVSLKTTSWENPYKNNKSLWIIDMVAAYKRAGLSNNAIKNLIAKNALESGWGKSVLGDFNFGNITPGSAWKGRFVNGKDHDSKGNSISLKFRAYDSLDNFVQDEIQFLTKLYDFSNDDDIDTFLNKLQGNNKGKRKYAEASNYKAAVKAVYNSLKNKPEYNN